MRHLLWVVFTAAALLSTTSMSFGELLAENGKATLRKENGIYFVDLYGEREEMHRQYGELLKDRIEDSAFPYFSTKIHNTIETSWVVKKYPKLGDLAKYVVKTVIAGPMIKKLTDEDKASLEAFAEGAGVSIEQVQFAQVIPDMGQWISSQLFGSNEVLKDIFLPIPNLGCTSFAVDKSQSPSGLIHARNLDYDGYGVFDAYPTVVAYHTPEDQLDYVSFGSLGLPTAGITAINEAGISLGIHQLYINQSSVTGRPALSLTEEVIRKATTIDEAIEILKSTKVASPWNVVLTSHKENRVVSIEISPKGIEVNEPETKRYLATNHSQTELTRKDEYFYNYPAYLDTKVRYENLERILKGKLSVTLQSAIDIISSSEVWNRTTGRSQRRDDFGIIGKNNNMQSLVFVPESDQVYFAVSPLAEAKPTHGMFYPIKLNLLSKNRGDGKPTVMRNARSYRNSSPFSQARIEAAAHYRHASRLGNEDKDYEKALPIIEKAIELYPQAGIYSITKGMMLMMQADRMKSEGEFKKVILQAREAFLKALDKDVNPYQKSMTRIFIGMMSDLVEDREVALTYYEKSNPKFFKPLAKRVKGHLKRPFKRSEIKGILIDYPNGDVLSF